MDFGSFNAERLKIELAYCRIKYLATNKLQDRWLEIHQLMKTPFLYNELTQAIGKYVDNPEIAQYMKTICIGARTK
jgi:hypothetical protein